MTTLTHHSKPQKLISEIPDITKEAIGLLGSNIKNAGFGSLNIVNTECALYIYNADSHQKRTFAELNTLYDNKIEARSTVTNGIQESIKDIPVNYLGMTDYTLFTTDFGKDFDVLLKTGLARRLTFSFQEPRKNKMSCFTKDELERKYHELKMLGVRLFQEVFNCLDIGACFAMTSEAHDELNKYSIKINDLANEEEEPKFKAEIRSRAFKALKVSGLYACLAHPHSHFIFIQDMQQAVASIEYMSQDFKRFCKYKPRAIDRHDVVLEFLKEHLNKEFTGTELKNHLQRLLGYSRSKMKNNFDGILEEVENLAMEDGYILQKDETKCKNGIYYSLVKCEDKPLSKNINPVDDLVGVSNIDALNAHSDATDFDNKVKNPDISEFDKLDADVKSLNTNDNNNLTNFSNLSADQNIKNEVSKEEQEKGLKNE